jgi:hypothetical protein
MTSRWMLEVEKIRDVEVKWHIFSLSVLNEGREVPEQYQSHMANGWMFGRVICAAKQSAGEAVVLPLYTAMGNRLHPGQAELSKTVIAEALNEAGLPADLLQAAEDKSFDETLRASTAEALKLVGDDIGTPVIAIDGVAFFGPVISPAPKGEAAGRLWDGVLNVAKIPGFFELKRTRTVDPIFD